MKNWVKITIGIIISSVLLAVLFQFISFGDILSQVKQMSLSTLLGAFLIYSVIYVLKTQRFRYLFGENIKFSKLFPVVCLHNLFNQVIPMRIGELSFVYLTKKFNKINIGESAASLLIARVYDGLMIILIMVATAFFISNVPEGILFYVYLISGIFFISIAVMAVLFIGRKKILPIITKIARKLAEKKIVPGKMIEKGKALKSRLSTAVHSRKHSMIFMYSLAIWVLSYVFFAVVIKGISPEIETAKVIFAASLVNLGLFIPLHSFANIGTSEGIWSISLIVLGVSRTIAIGSAIILHSIQIIFFLIWGLFGFIAVLARKQ